MFTGLIREVGSAVRLATRGREASLMVAGTLVLAGAKPGESIAVDGACLTVESLSGATSRRSSARRRRRRRSAR